MRSAGVSSGISQNFLAQSINQAVVCPGEKLIRVAQGRESAEKPGDCKEGYGKRALEGCGSNAGQSDGHREAAKEESGYGPRIDGWRRCV